MDYDDKLDLILDGIAELLQNQSKLADGVPQMPEEPEEPGEPVEPWIYYPNGTRRRNPEWTKFDADLWDLGKAKTIETVDISGIPVKVGTVNGQALNYGANSYHVLKLPDQRTGVSIRASGNNVLRLLGYDKASGEYTVEAVATLAGGGFIHEKGAVPGNGGIPEGEIWILQVSDRPDCGSVYTSGDMLP